MTVIERGGVSIVPKALAEAGAARVTTSLLVILAALAGTAHYCYSAGLEAGKGQVGCVEETKSMAQSLAILVRLQEADAARDVVTDGRLQQLVSATEVIKSHVEGPKKR